MTSTFLYICDKSQRNYVTFNDHGEIQSIRSRNVVIKNIFSFSKGDAANILGKIAKCVESK